VSLFGEPLVPPPLSVETRRNHEARLLEARTDWERDSHDPEAVVWLGRRTAYLGRYREAIAIYTRGIEEHPEYATLYRHRGHRYITLRQFDSAITDLERAADLVAGTPDEIEPDGLPNARNTPTSTSHSNIWYHLGLAYYLTGDLEQALRCYRECLALSKNPDMLCATTYWLYLTLRRLGRVEEAVQVLGPIHADMDIIENRSYHRLLMTFRGQHAAHVVLREAQGDRSSVDFATVGYGVGSWYLAGGERRRALGLYREVRRTSSWAAFGHIAAEADLKRLGETRPWKRSP
jgi:tetratricopeptide (TPR) repeat protein